VSSAPRRRSTATAPQGGVGNLGAALRFQPLRRALIAWLAASGLPTAARAEQAAPRTLVFPRDHGAHGEFGIEWWYATGWLQRADASDDTPAFGFQLTFFRSRTGLAQQIDSRFAARQLLFAHAALSDVTARRLVHAERIARWNGDAQAPRAAASTTDTRVHIGAWRFERNATRYEARLGDETAGFAFDLALTPTQPVLLQGEQGFSRKGPRPDNASHYYSQPHLAVHGQLTMPGVQGQLTVGARQRIAVRGRAWLDHEWSGSLMPDGAVGWDWIGINLDDGGALTAFRLRDARGGALWSGGSHRSREGALRIFGNGEAVFEPLQTWTSAATRATYPVRWRLRCPAGEFELQALFEAQELDGRNSTGSVYWEGLSALKRQQDGARVGWGYLEMTGYAAPLKL
jgi:predicted secreted hydrolase